MAESRELIDMGEDGEERERTEGLVKMDSMESRWVYQDDNDESDFEDEEAEGQGSPDVADMDSEDEDNVEQRLIRTGPRVDSFDVEALEVPGAHRNDFEVSFLSSIFSCFPFPFPLSFAIAHPVSPTSEYKRGAPIIDSSPHLFPHSSTGASDK